MKIDLHIPICWNDLKESQLEYLSRLIQSGITDKEILTRCFIRFADLKLIKRNPVIVENESCFIFKKKNGPRFPLDVDRFTSMALQLEYLISGVDLFRNPEQIGNYHGCDFRLYGISLEEYLMADTLYNDFTKTADVNALNMLLAIFYRKKVDQWNEGINLERWAKRFRFVPLHRKYIIYLWYTGVKGWIIKKYPCIFSGDTPSDLDSPADEIIMGMLSSLNNEDVTKNRIIKATEVNEVLYELNKRIETSQSLQNV